MHSRAVAHLMRVGLLTALCACGSAEAPYVPKPSPTCTPPGTPVISAAAAASGPAEGPTSCRKPIGQSALPAEQVQHLGVIAVNQPVRFSVPAGTGSFSIVLQAVTASTATVTFTGSGTFPNAPVPLKITDPSGAVFYDDTNVPFDGTKANAVYRPSLQGLGAFTVPNTARSLSAWARGVPAGIWTAVVGDYAAECGNLGPSGCSAGADASGTYDVTVLLRPGPVPTTGALDLDLHLVSTRFTAAGAAADPGLARLVATLNTVVAKAGLCLGNVTFIDVPAWAKAKYAMSVDVTKRGPCDDAAQLSTLSRAGRALPIFLVDDLRGSGGGSQRAVGLDGAIPGPSSIGGTIGSGALVNAADVGHGSCGAEVDIFHCGSDAAAAVVAHEAGHWLGLFHTVEQNGSASSPLTDTGAGTTNLMYWLTGGLDVTAQQGQVMRANALIR